MHKVRTKKQPHLELEVDGAEYLDLERQGLLLLDSEPAAEEKPNKSQAHVVTKETSK